MNGESLTVTQAVGLAKRAIEEGVAPLWVEGELSGFKRHLRSGHLYFDLKDAHSRVSCVMWRDSARRLRFDPSDGLSVRAHGRFGVYDVQGRLQIYADALEPAGLGELAAALERLKARLAAEGLFDPERKRPLPVYPSRIGVATSPTGAAIRDILRVLGARWPTAEVVHFACSVQGSQAAGEIVAALSGLQEIIGLDVIILGRGGGSIEDLWCFNEEIVVRTIADCRIPIVTGIGHEIDLTLADLAADLRAATPSQAAELAVPDGKDLLRMIEKHRSRLRQLVDGQIGLLTLRLSGITGSHGLKRPIDDLRVRSQRIDDLSLRLTRTFGSMRRRQKQRLADLTARWRSRHPRVQLELSRRKIADGTRRLARSIESWHREKRERLRTRAEHLEAIGPKAVLSRGYAICLRRRDQRAVRFWNDVDTGESIDLVLGCGSLGCKVEERNETWGTEGPA